MARIAGIDLPKNKRGEIGLTYIYGIGRSTARKILAASDISFDKKVEEWNDDELAKIRTYIGEKLATLLQRVEPAGPEEKRGIGIHLQPGLALEGRLIGSFSLPEIVGGVDRFQRLVRFRHIGGIGGVQNAAGAIGVQLGDDFAADVVGYEVELSVDDFLQEGRADCVDEVGGEDARRQCVHAVV